MAHPDKSSVYLDPAEAAAAQRARRHKFHTEDVTRLRVIGFAFNALGVVVHNWLIFHLVDWTASAQHAAVLIGYALFAWVVLAACSAASAAWAWVGRRPPSEKESGVTFRIPMTQGRSASSSKRPQIMGGS